MRLIDSQHQDKPRTGTAKRIHDEPVRLSQHATTGFLGSALHSFEEQSHGRHRYRMYCNFAGLSGTNGPLPLHYTEYADQRARHHHDPAFREFLDLFNHRMLSLFYRAVAEFEPAIGFDRPGQNNFKDILGSLAGLLPAAAQTRDAIPDLGKLYHASWLGSRTASPDAITSMLGEHFGIRATVREFVGGWLPLADGNRSTLGGRRGNVSLGVSSYIGRRVWSISHKFVVSIGPLSWQEFQAFRPGGNKAARLRDMMQNIVGDEWDWDLELKLAGGEVRTLALDHQRKLGFNSFLGSGSAARTEATEICINKKFLDASTAARHKVA